ncbi:hypothetical protein JOC33_004070 [Thalassobacillus pellis]|nr:hypothetical protein [Thalassobacillus pellis]
MQLPYTERITLAGSDFKARFRNAPQSLLPNISRQERVSPVTESRVGEYFPNRVEPRLRCVSVLKGIEAHFYLFIFNRRYTCKLNERFSHFF